MLMSMLFDFEHRLGHRFPIDRFGAEMGIEQMEHAVRCTLDPLVDPVASAAVTCAEAGLPLFLLPGIGGDEPRLASLRRVLQPAVPMVALRYVAWPRLLQRPSLDFAGIVRHCVQQIEEAAPSGPVRLAGYSYGCRVAHAVAAVLIARGRVVAEPVLLLDGAMTASRLESRRGVFGSDDARYSRRERAARWAAGMLIHPGGRWALRLVAAAPGRWLAGPFGFFLRKYLAGACLDHPRPSIQPRPIELDAILFRSDDRTNGEAPGLGWTPFWRTVGILPVPGDHLTMLDPPNLAELGDFIKMALTPRTRHAAKAPS